MMKEVKCLDRFICGSGNTTNGLINCTISFKDYGFDPKKSFLKFSACTDVNYDNKIVYKAGEEIKYFSDIYKYEVLNGANIVLDVRPGFTFGTVEGYEYEKLGNFTVIPYIEEKYSSTTVFVSPGTIPVSKEPIDNNDIEVLKLKYALLLDWSAFVHCEWLKPMSVDSNERTKKQSIESIKIMIDDKYREFKGYDETIKLKNSLFA